MIIIRVRPLRGAPNIGVWHSSLSARTFQGANDLAVAIPEAALSLATGYLLLAPSEQENLYCVT